MRVSLAVGGFCLIVAIGSVAPSAGQSADKKILATSPGAAAKGVDLTVDDKQRVQAARDCMNLLIQQCHSKTDRHCLAGAPVAQSVCSQIR